MNTLIREIKLDDPLFPEILKLSEKWDEENSCRGYEASKIDDFKAGRLFVMEYKKFDCSLFEIPRVIGYIYGVGGETQKDSTVAPEGTRSFEIQEFYIRKELRSQGFGKDFYDEVEQILKSEGFELMQLVTATKDYKSILHFYIDELEMTFWHASLFKKL